MQEEKHVGNEELIAATSRTAISGFAAHERRRLEIIGAVKTLDQPTKVLNREGYNLKRSSVYLSSFPKRNKRREMTCKNSTSEGNFFQELEISVIRAQNLLELLSTLWKN